MSGKRLTELERKVLVSEYLSGKPLSVVSKKYDVARSTVACWARRAGVLRKVGRPRYAERMAKEILGWEVD